jgi:hypothetical protein
MNTIDEYISTFELKIQKKRREKLGTNALRLVVTYRSVW